MTHFYKNMYQWREKWEKKAVNSCDSIKKYIQITIVILVINFWNQYKILSIDKNMGNNKNMI